MYISRRGFLKSGGLALGTAVLAGNTAALTGCSGSTSGTAGTNGNSAASQSYSVYETDILIIGGGIGALSAGFEATKSGRKVTMVDKGPFRASGATGMNWDVQYGFMPANADGSLNPVLYQHDSVLQNIVNKKAQQNAMLSDPNRSIFQYYMNKGGECFPHRNADGSDVMAVDTPYFKMGAGGFPRHAQDEISKSPLMTVHDRTMITDVLMSNGQCIGAVGVALPTGKFVVYRANAVILSAGGCGWFNGWVTVAAKSMNVPDNTSDVEMAAYRRGARVGDAEYGSYELHSIQPTGIAYGFNAGIGAEPDASAYIVDAKRVPFLMADPTVDKSRVFWDRNYFKKLLATHMMDPSNLGPNGGLYLDLSSPAAVAGLRISYARSISLWKENFGIDVTKELVEFNFEMGEHGGAPVIDDTMMTDIPGLFCSRGAGVYGTEGGVNEYTNRRMGSYTLRSALKYLETVKAPTTIDFTQAENEIARLVEIRTRRVAGGLRPHLVRQRIQKACGTCMSAVRTTANLQAASAELARIRKEDLPHQVLTDTSTTYSTEWKMAIENYNLIDIAEMSVNATLTRTESRGAHIRPEYPTQDDVNWKCMLTAKLVNGKMTFSKYTPPDTISWDSVTWENV
ncbi:FAD-binding protein [Oryzomonas rubra]|nr:FAD-binding protein [Oryzomonas rubra]